MAGRGRHTNGSVPGVLQWLEEAQAGQNPVATRVRTAANEHIPPNIHKHSHGYQVQIRGYTGRVFPTLAEASAYRLECLCITDVLNGIVGSVAAELETSSPPRSAPQSAPQAASSATVTGHKRARPVEGSTASPPKYIHAVFKKDVHVGYRFRWGDVRRCIITPHLSMQEKLAKCIQWLDDARAGRQLEESSRVRMPGNEELPVNVYPTESGKFMVNFSNSRKARIKAQTFDRVEEAVAYKATSLEVLGVLDGIIDGVAASA